MCRPVGQQVDTGSIEGLTDLLTGLGETTDCRDPSDRTSGWSSLLLDLISTPPTGTSSDNRGLQHHGERDPGPKRPRTSSVVSTKTIRKATEVRRKTETERTGHLRLRTRVKRQKLTLKTNTGVPRGESGGPFTVDVTRHRIG